MIKVSLSIEFAPYRKVWISYQLFYKGLGSMD
jgi:hypothetical protein